MEQKENNMFDVVVVGAGHAGTEAALAAARMHASTLLLTMNTNTIGLMSCNPAIGGLAKGQLVKEIDALGGEMGAATDDAGIQFRMLNRSKGPAVWSPRAQCDRRFYAQRIRRACEAQSNLEIRTGTVVSIKIENGKTRGVYAESGDLIRAQCVILTAGTFLNGVIHVGEKQNSAGRVGEVSVAGLTEFLAELGFKSGRLKTGTPPRIDGTTIDFGKTEIQPGDSNPVPFSFRHHRLDIEQLPCFLTYTNTNTHQELVKGFDRSPLFNDRIKGVGPRYCPSIEDKLCRFAERDRHQIFLEPEGRNTSEFYVNGFSTSLPEEVQLAGIHTVPGLENVKIIRFGYAVEYDFFPPTQLKPNLETKLVDNLFFAGQINGTTGYEEAACQGFMAGINAVLSLKGDSPFILQRSEAYIGVLLDDLVTKGTVEPYRMFTSRAEYRLLLRQDNADLRLMEYGNKYGIIADADYGKLETKKRCIEKALSVLQTLKPDPDEINPVLARIGSSPVREKESLYNLLKRPEVTLSGLAGLSTLDILNRQSDQFWQRVQEQVEIEIKYGGFIKRQTDQVDKINRLNSKKIPGGFDYAAIRALSAESQEKFIEIKPATIGQASRISGVSPADISVLLIHLARGKTF